MTIRLNASACKHQQSQGLTDAGILQAAQFPLWIEPLDDDNPKRELRLGFDDVGRLLELVVLIFYDGGELVIHAMKARPKYICLLPQ